MNIRSCSKFLIAVLLCVGCSGRTAGLKTVPVTGNVTYKGGPVAEAQVSFLGDGKTRPAIAITDEQGNFTLTTSRSGDGAVPGKHAVTVTKTASPPGKDAGKRSSMEEAAKAAQNPPAEAKVLHLIPESYSTADTSGLSFEVKEGQKNHFEIAIKD
jgi:hypothetical protein